MSVRIRRADAGDQASIVELIRRARLNSRNLSWERFLVAEDDGRIVGVRQVRVHARGTREIASGFVLPEYRHRGISARLMASILETEAGPLYLVCDQKWCRYYEPFGFARVSSGTLPADLRREYYLGRVITTLLSVPALRHIRIVPMARP